MSLQLARLTRRFTASQIFTHPSSGFHYAKVDSFISRLNDELGLDWEVRVRETGMEAVSEATRSGKEQFRAHAVADLSLTIDGKTVTRSGTGACTSHAVDTAFKGAQAEALKKAANQFGIGNYLNNKRERDLVDLLKAKKVSEALTLLAKIEGVERADLLKHYDPAGVLGEMSKEQTQAAILRAAGLIS